MAPPSWTDLEARFRALVPAMKFYRLDYQWGSAGEYWYLQGGIRTAATTEFETLSTIAGDLLLTLPSAAVAPEALAETDAKSRWYLALWHHMTHQIPEHMGFENVGKKEGTIFAGTIQEPVHASATLCLRFSTVVVESPVSPARVALAGFKESTIGKVLWWFGEEPLRKLLGSALVAGVLAAISPIRHGIAALVQWLVSRFAG